MRFLTLACCTAVIEVDACCYHMGWMFVLRDCVDAGEPDKRYWKVKTNSRNAVSRGIVLCCPGPDCEKYRKCPAVNSVDLLRIEVRKLVFRSITKRGDE